MNKDESIAELYLKKHYDEIEHEPDGNIPPDFLIDSKIAVEVRRLNQQHRDGNKTSGLEEQGIPLIKAIDGELAKFPPRTNGDNYWLTVRYERDIGKLKDIRKNTAVAVQAFEAQNEKTPFSYRLSNNVVLDFFGRVGLPSSKRYKIGIESDNDSGGWVINLYREDIDHCIKEKEQKIAPYRSKYDHWWLVLVDHISCLSGHDNAAILAGLSKSSSFDRVIVINHLGKIQLEF